MGVRTTAAALTMTMGASLAPALALTLAPGSSPATAAPSGREAPTRDPARESPHGPEVTRKGTVHRLVTGTRKRETVSTVLRSSGRTIPLRGAEQLEPGRQSVTGVMVAGRLHVTSAVPDASATRAATRSSTTRAAAVQGRERSLILPVKYRSLPSAPTPTPSPARSALVSAAG